MNNWEIENPNAVLVTDCGSTTTKAILFERTSSGWSATYRGEAPTTVENPVADVTIGIKNSFLELEEVSGRKILSDTQQQDVNEPPLITPASRNRTEGIDLFLSTSSAGGGLQMIVAGVVSNMTAESAERAALGAGAIVMDVISADDGREPYEKVQKIRHLRPDIVLIAGGTDDGTIEHPLELAEIILQADPKPRFGETLRLPVIYAANSKAREPAQQILSGRFAFTAVANVRPSLEEENVGPARDAIHEIFLEHVMSHAPGYNKLIAWTPKPVVPTPAAVGDMVQLAAKSRNISILAVDIGGATTDVFSAIYSKDGLAAVSSLPEMREPSRRKGAASKEARAYSQRYGEGFSNTADVAEDGFASGSKDRAESYTFNRSVSANLGMSYSIANVMIEAGAENILRWIPFDLSADVLRERLWNKMVRPTSIPQTMEDLLIEQAVCREALRLALAHHKRLTKGLSGTKRKGGLLGQFLSGTQENSALEIGDIDLIIGSGGVLSHAPDRRSAALMLIDAFEPTGITQLAVDSVFMMPHLGVLSTVLSEAAKEIFFKDCLVPLGTVVAPLCGKTAIGAELLRIEGLLGGDLILKHGEIVSVPLAAGEDVDLEIHPLSKQIDIGQGLGRSLKCRLSGGHVGLILDGRGRPLVHSKEAEQRIEDIANTYAGVGLADVRIIKGK